MNDTPGIVAARQAHSSRCRQRVITALEQASKQGFEISISAIARRAGVDELDAARATNRELMTRLNRSTSETPRIPRTTTAAHD